MWLPTEKVLAGSPSFSTFFALSCHPLPGWLLLFNLLLFLCVFFCLLLVWVSVSLCCGGCRLLVCCWRRLNRLGGRPLEDACNCQVIHQDLPGWCLGSEDDLLAVVLGPCKDWGSCKERTAPRKPSWCAETVPGSAVTAGWLSTRCHWGQVHV